MKISISALVDIGKQRTNNEDAFIFCPDLSHPNWDQVETSSYTPIGRLGSLIVVADGMGGPNAGEVASSIAIDAIRHSFSDINLEEIIQKGDIKGFLQEVIGNAHNAIIDRVQEEPDTIGMGTTLVLCWVFDSIAYIAWCGDSRCYVYNPEKGLTALTKDHSYVQTLIDRGEMSEKDAFYHPDNNIITKGLGDIDCDPTPDVVTYSIKHSDILLLCSDGLCGLCRKKAIEKILDQHYDNITLSKEKLLNAALQAGGDDNICIALASILSDDKENPAPLSFWTKLKRLLH